MAYTLYIHEPVSDLPELSRHGFPPETFFTTALDWAAEDAIFEGHQTGEAHVVIMVVVDAPNILEVPEDDIREALEEIAEGEGEWQEEPEEGEEGRFEAGEEAEFQELEEEGLEEEEPEEELEEEEDPEEDDEEVEEEDWPQTLEEAIELTESATLKAPLPPQYAVVLGEPVEVVYEDLMPEEVEANVWFRFTDRPIPLASLAVPYWKRLLKGVFGMR